MSEPALNKFFSYLTKGLPYIVFSVSVIAALANIIFASIHNQLNASYDVTCFLLDLVEVIFLSVAIIIKKTPWYKK